MAKTLIGLTEKVKVIGPAKEKEVTARIDTGADVCSIDRSIAAELGLGPVVFVRKIKSAHGVRERPVLRAKIKIKSRTFINVRLTIADRSHMKYKMLIGKNILKKNFLIDPSKA